MRQIDARSSEPDFWKDATAAQQLMQRRRRLGEDVSLAASLARRSDDLAVLVGDVRLIEERTIYARIGDVVAYASVAVTVMALALAWRTGRRIRYP